MERRARTLAVALLVLVAAAGVGLALTGGVAVDGTIPLDDPDGPEVQVVTSNSEMVLDGSHGGPGRMDIVTEKGTIVFTGPDGTAARIHEDDITGEFTAVSQIDAGAGLTINPEDKPALTVGGGIDSVVWRGAIVDDGSTDMSYTASSSGSISIPTDRTDATVVAVDAGGNVLDQTTTDGSGVATFALPSGEYDVRINEPVSPDFDEESATPQDDEIINETPVELSIEVSDGDFAAEHGDEVVVTFFDGDGNELGNDTLSENGTASTTHGETMGGQNQWYVVAEDSYGNEITSPTFSYQVPDQLFIRDELTGELLNNTESELTVTFYSETITERRTTGDGSVPLEGLPVGEELVVVAEAENHYNRRIIIDSLVEQQDVYLLNQSVDSVEVIFTLEDRSGDFDSQDTKLYLEKAVPTDEGAETRIIAGDYFGLGRFPVVLEQDSRYNLRVENREGRVYDPGSYTASVADIETIRIGNVRFGPPEGDSYSVGHQVVGLDEGGDRLDFAFEDPEELTTDFQVRIFARGDTENATFEDSWSGPRGEYSFSVELEEDTTYMIEWSATRDGNDIGQRLPVGGSSFIPVPLDSRWLNGFAMLAVTFVASLGSPRYGSYIALATVAMAGMFMLVGWLLVSPVAWWVAATIAVGAHLKGGIR